MGQKHMGQMGRMWWAGLCLAAGWAMSFAAGFSADWAFFRGAADSTRVEVFYSVPYDLLEYEARDSGLAARFSVRFQMSGANGFSQDAVIFKQARIGSFREASQSRRSFVDGFGVSVRPGRYWLKMTLAKPAAVQSDTAGEVIDYTEMESVEDTIDVPDLSQGFALSSVQLAADVVPDSTTGSFSVIPNPARRYGGHGRERVYLYYETYGLAPEPDSYEVRVSVLRSKGKGTGAKVQGESPSPEGLDTVVAAEPMTKRKSGTRGSSALGVSVDGLGPGDYLLSLEVRDCGQSRGRQAAFRVVGEEEPGGPQSPYRIQLTELEKLYYRELKYIASKRELGYYNTLSDSGKEAYLAWFWTRHNLSEFARRMQTAETKYRTSRTSGLATDRGRVYVKYGEPDEVEHKVLEVDRKPREYWRYYGVGYLFIFIDVGGDGNFRLAYTSDPDEPKTGYENLLTQDEQEMLK